MQINAPVEELAGLPRSGRGHNQSYGRATNVDSADTSEAMMMARVSSFAARGLPCGKCSKFSSSYLADNLHRQWTEQKRRAIGRVCKKS